MRVRLLASLFAALGSAQAQVAWNLVTPSGQGPGARVAHAMAYDSARSATLLFGGYGLSTSPDSTWGWDGASWTLLASTGAPNRDSHALAFHVLTGTAITMGGRSVPGSAVLPSTPWQWNGATWSQIPSGPTSRHLHAMAYDSARGKVILFGGIDANFNLLRDTWEWDAGGWQLRSSSGPSARCRHSMAFDQQRAKTVLCGGGGITVGSETPETWLWNGTTWISTAASSPPVIAHAAAYHDGLGKVVLFGGEEPGGLLPSTTWLWDGSGWQALAIPGPSGRTHPAMAYDSVRGALVLYGGESLAGPSDEIWELNAGPPISATSTVFGQGCPSPGGTTALAAAPGSRPVVGTTLQLSLTNLPANLFAFPFGAIGLNDQTFLGAPLPASLDPIGATGCILHISIDHEIALVNAAGTASWPIAIPPDPYFVGLTVFAQGAVLLPGVNPANFVTSNAVRLLLGNQ